MSSRPQSFRLWKTLSSRKTPWKHPNKKLEKQKCENKANPAQVKQKKSENKTIRIRARNMPEKPRVYAVSKSSMKKKQKGHCVHQVSGIDRPRPRSLLEGPRRNLYKNPNLVPPSKMFLTNQNGRPLYLFIER